MQYDNEGNIRTRLQNKKCILQSSLKKLNLILQKKGKLFPVFELLMKLSLQKKTEITV
jgi:hypothetical protein